MNKKIAILDVPEPLNVQTEYVYNSYSFDESSVEDNAKRYFVLTGVLPQISSVVGGVKIKQLSLDNIQNLTKTNITTETLDGLLNFEEDLRIEDNVLISKELGDVKADALNLLSSWARQKGLRGDPVSIFVNETGLTFAGFEGDVLREGFIGADVPTRFIGTATDGILDSLENDALMNLQNDEETFWRIADQLEPETSLFVSRIGLYVEGSRRAMWKDAFPEKLPGRFIFLNENPAFNFKLPALHGFEYTFSVRGVFLTTVLDPNEQGNPLTKNKYLTFCASRPRFVKLESFEYERPKPPSDLIATWDYDESALRLRWNMPFDPKNVIKRVQLFKREAPNEPFRLLREWDWNDNLIAWDREGIEQIPRHISKKERVKGWWYDINFKPKPGNIAHYALAAVTTHGITSTYSIQITTRWLNSQQGVVNSLLSRAGAPKAYPNLFLENFAARRSGITNDVLNVNGFGKFHVLFDPELTQLLDEDDNILRDYRNVDLAITSIRHETLESNWVLFKTEDEKLVFGKEDKIKRKKV